MRTIAVHASKGGVGKTTLTVNLAYEIARLGNKVLVIDLDDQANSSLYLGVNKADELNNAKTLDEFDKILESFKDRKEIIDLLSVDSQSSAFDYKTYIHNSPFNKYLKLTNSNGSIDVIPSSYRTKYEQDKLTNRAGGSGITETILNKLLKKFNDEYDYIIMDTSPNLTPVTKNGLFASRYLLIPTQLEYFSAYGVSSVVRDVKRGVQEEMEGQRAILLGIVPTMTEPLRGRVKTKVNNFIKQLLEKAKLGTALMPEIKRTKSFSDAAEKQLPFRVFVDNKRQKSPSEMEALNQLSNLTTDIIKRIDVDESRR